MDIRTLGRLDLNLLVALEALIEEQSVSKAADRLFITQSAMSKTLGRLREVFDDQLFVRTANGMSPTPRTEQIAEHLPQVLQAVQCMVQPYEFNPMTTEAHFRVAIPIHICIWALPRLMLKLNAQAPRFSLSTEGQQDNQLEMLASGKLDVLIQVAQDDYSSEYDVVTMGVAPPMLLARAGHPLEGTQPSWEDIKRYPQIRTRIADINDKHFFKSKESKFISEESTIQPVLETDHLFPAMEVLCNTDYIMPSTPIFIEEGDLSKEIISLPIPENEELMFRFVLVTHERTRNSPTHLFLKQLFTEVVEEWRQHNDMPTLKEMREIRGFDY
ncbi:MAG: LysR family transcriptional regulator [Candidatus Pelagadaptatus aseana]|uniref:LysR family transcriptional regulator n=1 Tax=Candidatus Pelagadaptatus aseana TaxID=3120508 RepID=UPI0039B2B10A